MNFKRNFAACNFHDRLTSEHEDPANVAKRTLVRLPVEVGYVGILSKLGGFSTEDIAEIIGIRQDGAESRFERGSRLLQSEPFTYGGQG